jgi:opacity protein-like surface antigen
MKSLLLAVALLVALAGVAVADRSDEQTGDAAIVSGRGCFAGITIQTDGSNNVTFDIYDNATAASGDNMVAEMVVTTSTTNRYHTLGFSIDPCLNRYYNGIYVDITTSGVVKYMVYWIPY